MLAEALPRGCGPARRGTCVLNCQGVIMPWRGSELLHLCLSQVYYQTKYCTVRRRKNSCGLWSDSAAAPRPDVKAVHHGFNSSHTGQGKDFEMLFMYLFILAGKRPKDNVKGKALPAVGLTQFEAVFQQISCFPTQVRTKYHND